MYIKMMSLHLYYTAHASEKQLHLAIIAVVLLRLQKLLVQVWRGWEIGIFRGFFCRLYNHTNRSKSGNLPGNTEQWVGTYVFVLGLSLNITSFGLHKKLLQ